MKKSASKSKTSNEPKSPGLLIIISAPSGCGKTTVVDRLLNRHPDWVRSVSATTREPRLGEKNGEDYFFVPNAGFQKMESAGELLESARVFDQWYGTPRRFVMEHIQKGFNVLLAIDVQGTKKVRKVLDKAFGLLTIFILPPSVKVLRERLEGRKTESPGEIQKRIEIAQDEIKEAGSYDRTVMNQNLDQTVQEIETVIQEFQEKRSRKK